MQPKGDAAFQLEESGFIEVPGRGLSNAVSSASQVRDPPGEERRGDGGQDGNGSRPHSALRRNLNHLGHNQDAP